MDTIAVLPPARVGDVPTASPPPQLTRFVGRQAELAEIRRILQSSRLVTLTGVGGSGKTRLAVELLDRLAGSGSGEPRWDSASWIDLAPLADPALLPRHLSAHLGLSESLERAPLDALIEKLEPLTLLLVLDNCEHLVEASARVVHALLAACPGLTILATSREALGVDGETAWVVPPLSIPAPASPPTARGIAHSEAVQLFIGRAQAVQPGFVLTDATAPAVAFVCRRLDGIPLALELAAARLNVLTVEQIAERLDDVFGLLTTRSRTTLPRHRTLRGTIDWSHALLGETEQVLFRRLAVFTGGFTLEAAENVCAGRDMPSGSVLDLVSTLVEKSLVRSEAFLGEARFSLLEPVRQYASEKLGAAGERGLLRARHAAYFLHLAERAEPELRGGTRGTDCMLRVERDHDNLRAAAEWCSEDVGRVELQLRLDTALLWFYFAQGYFQEPRKRLRRGLEWAGVLDGLVRGRAYTALGYQAIWLGDYGQALVPLKAGVALLRAEDEPEALSFALTGLGAAVGFAGDLEAARALFAEAATLAGGREGSYAGGYPTAFLLAFASYWQGVMAIFAGDLSEARASIERGVQVARDHDDHPSMAHPLGLLARVLTLQGDLEAARACLADSLPIHAGHDDRWGLADALETAAHLAAAEGVLWRSARLVGAADALRRSMGLRLPSHQLADRGRLVDAIESGIGAESMAEEIARGSGLTLSQVISEALGRGADRTPEAPAAQVAAEGRSGDADAAVEPDLRVAALGPLRIFRRGEELEAGAWGSAKPRELLLFLLCHPAGVTRDQVGLALWPEASSERVSNSFHVTLHRLRKALGDAAWISKAGERYVLAADLRCAFDAATFERDVPAATSAIRDGDGGIDRLRAALSLYRGPFLEDEVVGDWHLAIRDRLQRIHLDGLLALGGRLAAESRWHDAAEAYARVVAADDLHEEAYRHLMTSLARVGDRSQALRLYQRLCALLERELGARPEPETVALFERLQEAEAL